MIYILSKNALSRFHPITKFIWLSYPRPFSTFEVICLSIRGASNWSFASRMITHQQLDRKGKPMGVGFFSFFFCKISLMITFPVIRSFLWCILALSFALLELSQDLIHSTLWKDVMVTGYFNSIKIPRFYLSKKVFPGVEI